MRLHQLKPIHRQKKARRIGRGGSSGFYSGKGAKGQRSRASRKFKPIIREVVKRYPKLRGYKYGAVTLKPHVLNLEVLNNKFKKGETVSPKTLAENKLIRKKGNIFPQIKILGVGDIKTALIFENCFISESAKKKIEKAGGEIK